MSLLSTDDIERRCKDLVIQVAYAFYDSPYIIILYHLMHQPVWAEVKLAEKLGINTNELRRYFGKLQTHRLVKRYTNKERQAGDDRFQNRRPGFGGGGGNSGANPDGTPKLRDVFYWYIDYRELAQVTKYRLAMVRKGIEDSTKQNTGQMGFACPQCGKTFEVLQVRDLMDPSTGLLYCDTCSAEVTSYDPNTDPNNQTTVNADKMQHFNTSMRGIRDALKAIEGVMVPSLNIVAWIAQNVVVLPLPGQEGKEGVDDKAKYKIVIGEEGDEKERAEKARLAEAQRTQNALPVWYTHSTVTGSATALGIKADGGDRAGPSSLRKASGDGNFPKRDLADYYANLDDDDEDEEEEDDIPTPANLGGTPVAPQVKVEPGLEVEEEEEADEMEPSQSATPIPVSGGSDDVMVMVAGVAKPFSTITDDDEAYMTSEEREAYEALVMEM